MNVTVIVGNIQAEYTTDDGGYSPDVADDLRRHAVAAMRDLLAVAVAVGAYRADAAAVKDDEGEE